MFQNLNLVKQANPDRHHFPTKNKMSKPIITRQPDGNVFFIISAVAMALRRANQKDKELEFVKKAHASKSYEEVINLTTDYVVWAFHSDDESDE
jgi:hypothetical protein